MTDCEKKLNDMGFALQYLSKHTWQNLTGNIVIKTTKDKTQIKSFRIYQQTIVDLETFYETYKSINSFERKLKLGLKEFMKWEGKQQ